MFDTWKEYLIAFFNSYMLNSVFKKYMPKEEKPEDMELRPLFADDEAEGNAAQKMTE